MMKAGVIFLSLYCSLSMVLCQEESTGVHQDVFDTAAWVGNWIVSVGSYAGRQQIPWRRSPNETLENIPNIYIPRQLTANEIVRALKLTGKQQMLVEKNEMFDYLNFHLEDGLQNVTFVDNTNETLGFNNSAAQVLRNSPRSDFSYFVDEDVTGEYFVLSESLIQKVQHRLSQYSFLDASTITTVEELMELISFKKEQEQQYSWEDMIAEINSNYQKIINHLDEKGFVRTNDDGLYSIAKRGSDLAYAILNSTILTRERKYRFHGMDNDYNIYKKYQEFEREVDNMFHASKSIASLPSEISWDNFKFNLQSMYKNAIPQIHLFQYLIQQQDYLKIDTNIQGMSQLSDMVTKNLMDAMWGIFGRIHPLRPQPPQPPRPPRCGSTSISLNNIRTTTIMSPGYPSSYPKSQDCTWIITAPTGSKMRINFLDFHLESSRTCQYDYVSVYDGTRTMSGRVANMCGTRNTTEDITTSTNKMIVKFHSDSSQQRRGFKADIIKV